MGWWSRCLPALLIPTPPGAPTRSRACPALITPTPLGASSWSRCLPTLLTPTPLGAPTWSRCLPALITPTPPECPQLEQGLCGGQVEPQDGPVGTILESLVLPSGRLEAELAGPVFYLLQALAGKGLGEGQGRGRDVSSSGWPLEALSPKVSPQC